ncbi:MAG: prepilin-type N-terminal cleavage/methylation domain-containing protein [Candidatus Omnitrophica bacterium]|nr:prepilin-type N-terminal cleavage/methylation domain-containing protein [Candidatus Omnitrophota bacterium]
MNNKGFTLVEVLVVVIIIGILASIGIPQFADSIEKAKGAEARSGLGHIQTGEKIYFAEREYYVGSTWADDLDISLSQRYWTFTITTPSSTAFIATATRSGGTRVGQTIWMDQAGTLSGDWEFVY